MIDTISRWLTNVGADKDRTALRAILNPIADQYSTRMLSNSTLVIGTVSKTVPKTGAAISYGVVQGVPIDIAAGTAMPALVGTVVNATFNVYCFFVDKAEAITSAMGTAGATWAAVKFPPIPQGKVLLGFVIVNPTGTGNFVGGTTELDDGTVTPGAVYISPVGPFDTTVLL